jgi:hypothetical protein
VRVDGPKGPRVLKVLRFDSHYVAEGCGGGCGATAWPGFRGFRRFKGFRGFRGEGIACGDNFIISVTG